jgi:hypothetical protein
LLYSQLTHALFIVTSATIKITLNKLKRDLEKSPIQQAIENELSRKRELDAPYEDITEVTTIHLYLYFNMLIVY